MKTCFFTGHREISKKDCEAVKSRLREEILTKINGGVRIFIAGGAKGFDTMAAEQVIEMREDYDIISLYLYIPCTDQDATWQNCDRERYRHILKSADKVFYITDAPYKKGCMAKRNRAMVEASDCGISYVLRNGSGSSQTMRMAQEKGIDIVNISQYLKISSE